jgi:hypothetical protein
VTRRLNRTKTAPPWPSILPTAEVLQADALTQLRQMPSASVHTCITSPPYWQLRDYKQQHQLGQEPTISEYLERLVEVFAEVRRVLRPDGTLWVNMGDKYSSGGRGGGGSYMKERAEGSWSSRSALNGWTSPPPGYRDKELLGRVLSQSAGSSRSRLAARAIRAGSSEHGCCIECGAPWKRTFDGGGAGRTGNVDVLAEEGIHQAVDTSRPDYKPLTFRDWTPACKCKSKQRTPCMVLDPFVGTGTTLIAAKHFGRSSIGIELSGYYCQIARNQLARLAHSSDLATIMGSASWSRLRTGRNMPQRGFYYHRRFSGPIGDLNKLGLTVRGLIDVYLLKVSRRASPEVQYRHDDWRAYGVSPGPGSIEFKETSPATTAEELMHQVEGLFELAAEPEWRKHYYTVHAPGASPGKRSKCGAKADPAQMTETPTCELCIHLMISGPPRTSGKETGV